MVFLALPAALPSARTHPSVCGAGKQARLLVTFATHSQSEGTTFPMGAGGFEGQYSEGKQ